MEDREITPAASNANIADNGQLSPQEFQATLYNWFNKKGLVSNMRSHLRMKMIETLRNTTIGESLNAQQNASIESQALNVLIADYLFQHRYDYSLSVFSTEVPIKTLVSEFCFFVFNKDRSKVRHKIEEENVMSILDSLGIGGSRSGISRDILKSYQEVQNGSLLLCVLRIVLNNCKTADTYSNEGQIEDIGKFLRKTMMRFNVPMSTINNLIDKINSIVRTHLDSLLSTVLKEYEDEKKTLKSEYVNKEAEFKQKLVDVDRFLAEETIRIEKEHKKLVYLTENMVDNEKKLADKSKEMEAKLHAINELEGRLNEELESCGRHQKCDQKHCDEECEKNRKLVEELEFQKNSFEKIAENQNVLIANLTAKSNVMYKQLQEGMFTIENLRAQLVKQKESYEQERKKEEILSSSDAGTTTIGTDGEGDHADDVIKETRMKLSQLEKESLYIEQKYKEYRSTH